MSAIFWAKPPTSPPPLLVLPGEPQSAKRARTFVRGELCKVPSMPGGHIEDVELVVSELVGNAVRYGTEPDDFLAVSVVDTGSGTRVEVRDPVRRHPRHRPASTERQRGRGLFILDAPCPGRWGAYDTPFGKAVWAEVAR
ncbi:ATP-binding protein [Streptomyces sp. NRRL F-5630]|uniref:ATP-binding protein n=1 Tax=Streptomyces sp. NRRL F-5630 TaxID=1463864 RepID=UPI0004C6EEA4|nr:ATP-binding protein [Streptomyces sp. NRRL F-5630]